MKKTAAGAPPRTPPGSVPPGSDAALVRGSAFSYVCRACSRCCYDKLIQVNPYEVAQLARNLGISREQFIAHHLEADAPYLRRRENGACVFLTDKGCGVHPDRPLVCRLYPLGRFVAADGTEHFRHSPPHPQTEGTYGTAGTVTEFLAGQRADAYMAAADRYQALYYRLLEAAAVEGAAGRTANAGLPIADWLDMDRLIGRYCAERGLPVPDDPEKAMTLHVAAIDEMLGESVRERRGEDDEPTSAKSDGA